MGPDFFQHSGEVDGKISKFTIKKDGDEAIVCIVDIVFQILNSKEAEALDLLFPGAKQTYINCTDKGDDAKEKREITPSFDSAVHVELANASSGRSLVKGTATLPKIVLSASKKVTTLTVKCQWGGQSEGVAANLAHGLSGATNFIWEFTQQSLLNPKKGEDAKKLVPEIGDIVHAEDGDGDDVFGRVVEVLEDEQSCLVSDFGDDGNGEWQIAFEHIHSKWKVNADDEHFDKCLTSYKQRCSRRDLLPSWEWITVAVGQAFQDGAPGDGAHVLTKAIIARALKLQVEADSGADPDGGSDESDQEPVQEDGADPEEVAPETAQVETEPPAPPVANSPVEQGATVIEIKGRRRKVARA